MAKYTTATTLQYYGTVNNPSNTTPTELSILTQALDRAEMAFESRAGSGFIEDTFTNTHPVNPFIDGDGFLWLIAREAAPITAVTSVSVMDMSTQPGVWQTVAWDTNNLILPYVDTNPVRASQEWWTCKLLPTSPSLGPKARGKLTVKWTYKGGFASAPNSLAALICRLAWWEYKMREAPMGRIVTTELGLMELPLVIPPDVEADIKLWTRPMV